MLHFISKLHKIKLSKKSSKTSPKMYSKGSDSNQNMLCIPHHHRLPKHYSHIIFERQWNTKPSIAVKVVKGLPHMCPYHQPNPKRELITYIRWITSKPNCYLFHTIKWGINIHFVSLHTQIFIECFTCSLAILCEPRLRHLDSASHMAAQFYTNPKRYLG